MPVLKDKEVGELWREWCANHTYDVPEINALIITLVTERAKFIWAAKESNWYKPADFITHALKDYGIDTESYEQAKKNQ
jgi:hypothetical protein